jgi:hypothetical protein
MSKVDCLRTIKLRILADRKRVQRADEKKRREDGIVGAVENWEAVKTKDADRSQKYRENVLNNSEEKK